MKIIFSYILIFICLLSYRLENNANNNSDNESGSFTVNEQEILKQQLQKGVSGVYDNIFDINTDVNCCDTCIYLSDSTEVRNFVKEIRNSLLNNDTTKLMSFFDFPLDIESQLYHTPEELKKCTDWKLMCNDLKREPILFFKIYPKEYYEETYDYDLDLWYGEYNNNKKFWHNSCCFILFFTTRSWKDRHQSLSYFDIKRRNGKLKITYVCFAG